MTVDNKSLGRFKLTGISPAPRGLPQVQVAFDIDANGILQVTARDKATGREQSVIIQGTSTISEKDIDRMVQEASIFAEKDRQRRERIEKRNNAKALTDQALRRIKDITLDFGAQFTSSYRRQIEVLNREIIKSLNNDDERSLDKAKDNLEDLLHELNREVRLQYEEEDEGILESIKRTFANDSVTDSYIPYDSDYNSTYYQKRKDYESSEYERYNDQYDEYNMIKQNCDNHSFPQKDLRYSRDQYESYQNRNRFRQIPNENQWDEEEEDWF